MRHPDHRGVAPGCGQQNAIKLKDRGSVSVASSCVTCQVQLAGGHLVIGSKPSCVAQATRDQSLPRGRMLDQTAVPGDDDRSDLLLGRPSWIGLVARPHAFANVGKWVDRFLGRRGFGSVI